MNSVFVFRVHLEFSWFLSHQESVLVLDVFHPFKIYFSLDIVLDLEVWLFSDGRVLEKDGRWYVLRKIKAKVELIVAIDQIVIYRLEDFLLRMKMYVLFFSQFSLFSVRAISIMASSKIVELNLNEEEKINFQNSIKSVVDLFNAAKKIDKNLE